MRSPHFSVIIPLYNDTGTIARAVRSVLHQTVQDVEIIVVNDGSEDDGPSIVETIKDPRIRLLHQKNLGVSVARNRGIRESRSPLIAFLDADDAWLPGFLEKIQELVDGFPECGLYATRYFYQSPSGRKKAAAIHGVPEDFEGILTDYFNIAARSNPPVCASAACARKDALHRTGGFVEDVALGEDLLAWAKLATDSTVAYSMEPLAIYYTDIEATCRDLPATPPQWHDVVGEDLELLFHECASSMRKSLGRYCAHWHKMRCSLFLRLGMRYNARREIEAAMRHSLDYQVFLYWFASFLPEKAIERTFRLVKLFL
jgi:glycosyltransferase involved in cell wall biosynthesis